MSENNSEFGAFLAGFVIGGLVGAATALILAPQSGHETRNQITNRGQALQQAGGTRFQQYRDTASSSLTGTRERVQEVGGQMQEQARIVLDSGRERASMVRDQVTSAAQQAESDETENAASTTEAATPDGDTAEEPKTAD